jgi:DNA-binding NtrC family response regulator
VRRILVVDDQPDVCEVIVTFLAERGYAVDRAVDSFGARRLLARDSYDGVLLDVLMPGEGGLALADIAERQGARVLLMSGHPEAMAMALLQSPYELLRKPFRLVDLEAAVATLLDAAPETRSG